MAPPEVGQAPPTFSSIPPPQEPSFTSPIVFSTIQPLMGLHLPVQADNPFLAQPAWNQSSGILINPNQITADDEFFMAVRLISSNPEEAGRLFTKIRDEMRQDARRLVGALDRIYVEVTFGSALWGKVTSQTFDDLRRIRKKAKALGDMQTRARELLIRSVAHIRNNDDESAFNALDHLMRSEKLLGQGEIRVAAHVLEVNLLMNRAIRHTGVTRSFALNTLANIMRTDLSEVVKGVETSGGEHRELMGSLARLYRFVAEFLLAEHRSENAKETAFEAKYLFPNDPVIQNLFRAEQEVEGGFESGEVSPLRQLLTEERTIFDHIIAGAAEMLNNAQFPNNQDFWKYAVGGAFAAAGLLTAFDVVSSIEPSLSDTMLASAIGATSAVLVGKLKNGITAPETKQAALTGYTDVSLTRVAFKEAMKLFGTYVFFGGAVPLADHLPNFMTTTDNGQLHGLGSLIAYVTRQTGVHLEELIQAVSNDGLAVGLANFWQNWVDTSYFAEAINNGLTLPFHDPWGKIFPKAGWENVPEILRTFSFEDTAHTAMSLGLTLLYGYTGLSGLYAFASMNPTVAAFFKNHLPENTKYWVFPGAFLATWAAMIASGVNVWGALPIIFTNYFIQHRHWVQGGGNWNILNREVFKSLPFIKIATAGAVQLLYIGPGAAIKPAYLPTIHDVGVAQYLWNNVEAHCGMVGFLAALGVFHAVFTGLSIPQTLKAKFAKAWTYEIPANVTKLALGWTSAPGQIAGSLIKEVAFGAPVTNSIREAGNSQIQDEMFMSIIQRFGSLGIDQRAISLGQMAVPLQAGMLAEGQGMARLLATQQTMMTNARRLRDEGVNAALRGEAYGFLNNVLYSQNIDDQLLTLIDAYFMDDDNSILLGPNLRREWYTKIIYRALTQPERPSQTTVQEVVAPEGIAAEEVVPQEPPLQSTSSERVAQFLDRLLVIANDVSPNLRHTRYNLIVATLRAMAGRTHGSQIEEFFTTGPGKNLIEAYGLQDVFGEIKGMKKTEGPSAWKIPWPFAKPNRWIERHLLNPNATKPGRFNEHPVDAFYNAAAVAGRRFTFSAPFTGRSIVQNGSPFSSLLLSAARGDPAFQTTADATLFAGTLYGILMTPTMRWRYTTKDYETRVLKPMLELIKLCAQRLGDNRKDVRHNLLVTVWLASQGPHGGLIRNWIEANKGVYQANGIYGQLKIDGSVARLPRALRDKGLIKELFGRYLWNSDNSADGIIVYPVQYHREERELRSATPPRRVNIAEIQTDSQKQGLINESGRWLAYTIFRDGLFYDVFDLDHVRWLPPSEPHSANQLQFEFGSGNIVQLGDQQRQQLMRLIVTASINDVAGIASALNVLANGGLAGKMSTLQNEIRGIMASNTRLSAKLEEIFTLAAFHGSSVDPVYNHFINVVTSWEKAMEPIDPEVDFFAVAKLVIMENLQGSSGPQQGGATPAATPQAPAAPNVPATPASPSQGAQAPAGTTETTTTTSPMGPTYFADTSSSTTEPDSQMCMVEATPPPVGGSTDTTSTVVGLADFEGGSAHSPVNAVPSAVYWQLYGAQALYQRRVVTNNMQMYAPIHPVAMPPVANVGAFGISAVAP